MCNIDFENLDYSYNYTNTFKTESKTYHYKNASIIECQFSHILSIFLNKIGIKTVYYDYDEKSGISYCESIIKADETFLESPEVSDDLYGLDNYYFSLKKDLQKFSNAPELTKELAEGYFIACLFRDTDKNIGYVFDSKKNVTLSPYYDFGTPLTIYEPYEYETYFSDILIVEDEMDKFCKENNYGYEDIIEDFNSGLRKYSNDLEKHLNNTFSEKVFLDCIKNIDPEIIKNILNFDIKSTIELDHHSYSDNSKKVLITIFNIFYKDVIAKLKKYYNLSKKQESEIITRKLV